jgi:transposase
MSDERQGKRYSREFKEHAVALADGGEKPVSQVEAELGIGHGQISRWRKEVQARYRPEVEKNAAEPDSAEVKKLRKEIAELREEREILRKALAIFSENRK